MYDPEQALAENGGELEYGWFSGLKPAQVLDRLSGFLSRAPAEIDGLTDETKAARAREAWVYGNAYRLIASGLAKVAGRIDIPNEVSKTTDRVGPDYFSALADKWFAVLALLVPSASVPAKVQASVSLTARFRP